MDFDSQRTTFGRTCVSKCAASTQNLGEGVFTGLIRGKKG